MLERGPGVPRVVDPVGDRVRAPARQVADLGVVPVDDEHGLRRQGGRRGPPALGDVLELAVAVELVTEEVAEQHCTRPDPADDLRQRAFVDLEQTQLGVALGEEGGGDPGNEVRAGAVPGEPVARLEDLGSHRRRRRLAVRRRDDGGAVAKPCRERVDRAGIELPEQLARQRRAAARAGDPGELGGRARGQGLDGEAGAHQSASLPVDLALGTRQASPSFEGTSRGLTLPGEEPAHLRAYVWPGSTSWRGGFMRG